MVATRDVLNMEVMSEDEKKDGYNLLISFDKEVDGSHGVQRKALTNVLQHNL